jgi:hypothetical protein
LSFYRFGAHEKYIFSCQHWWLELSIIRGKYIFDYGNASAFQYVLKSDSGTKVLPRRVPPGQRWKQNLHDVPRQIITIGLFPTIGSLDI